MGAAEREAYWMDQAPFLDLFPIHLLVSMPASLDQYHPHHSQRRRGTVRKEYHLPPLSHVYRDGTPDIARCRETIHLDARRRTGDRSAQSASQVLPAQTVPE
jgi:hypothetical protein